jgi:hypothetical protein
LHHNFIDNLKIKKMKQLLKKCLLMVVLFTTIESYSNEFTFQANDQTKNVTAISIDSVNEGSLFVIKDSAGLILYREQIEETGTYSKRFDLTNLPDADYYFELDKQDKIKVIPFTVKHSIARIIKDAEYEVIKPEVTVKNDRVYISKTSSTKENVHIKIYYEGKDLAFSEKFKNTDKINRIYDFSTSKKGNYTIVFKAEGRSYSNNINF